MGEGSINESDFIIHRKGDDHSSTPRKHNFLRMCYRCGSVENRGLGIFDFDQRKFEERYQTDWE